MKERDFEELESSEAWLAAFFRSSTAGLAILDSDFRYLRINDTLAAANGLPAEEHRGRTIREVIPKMADLLEPLLTQVIATKRPILDLNIKGETPAHPGRIRHWTASYFPLPMAPGRLPAVGVVIVEITSRVETERQNRVQASMLDQVRNAVIATDPHGIITYANQYAQALYQWSAEEMIGQNVVNVLVPPATRAAALAIMNKLAHARSWQGEFEVQRKDGSVVPMLLVDSPLIDETGNFVGMVGVGADITESKRAQEELRRSGEQLRALAARLNSIREEETRRIAREVHDVVGQQLTALKFDLQRLEDAVKNCDASLREQVTRLTSMTDQAIVSTQEIATELRLGHLDLIGLAGAMKWQLRTLSGRTGLTVDGSAIGEMPDLGHDCAVTAYRIFQEALTNVVRHAGAKCVRVGLAADADQLILTVEDDGRGITERQKSDMRSLGILGMVERAQALGGRIDINATDGGTRVVARLPRHAP